MRTAGLSSIEPSGPWIASHRPQNPPPVTRSPSTKATGRLMRVSMACTSAGLGRSGDADLFDAGLRHFVHDPRDHARMGSLVRDDDDCVVGPLDVQALERRTQGAQIHLAPVHPDFAVLADGDEYVPGLSMLSRYGVVPRQDNARLLP